MRLLHYSLLTLATAGPVVATADSPPMCKSLTLQDMPDGTSLINITATERSNVTVQATRFNATGTISGISFCDVEVYLTHGTANDEVRIALWLPIHEWNGRFVGTGGAGFNAGSFDTALAEAIDSGYAAVATDAGVGLSGDPGPWANSTQLLENFIHLSVHEMTVVGKSLTTQFYGREPAYSYFYGCSQGGRQGYVEALRYPQDYDGISANSPAINWARVLPGFLWPYLLQLEMPLAACKFSAITAASISACDLLDGAEDGLIAYPEDCHFDALGVVGQEVGTCDGNASTITSDDATTWNKIRAGAIDKDGKPLWYGVEPGTDISYLVLSPFQAGDQWLKDFILRDSDYDYSNFTYDAFLDAFYTSVAEYGESWGSPDADLSPFRDHGGKLMTFHGWSDQSIPGNSTIEFWERAREAVSFGATDSAGNSVDDFYRLFMAPGVGHCATFSYGPDPWYGLDTLVGWVEEGIAPETLFASGFGQTRNLCHYPKELKYTGVGRPEDAESWFCA